MRGITCKVLFEADENYGPLTITQDYKPGDWGQLTTKGEEFIVFIGNAVDIKSIYKKFRHNGFTNIYEPYDYRSMDTKKTFPQFNEDRIYGLCIDPNDPDDTICVWGESAVTRFMVECLFKFLN